MTRYFPNPELIKDVTNALEVTGFSYRLLAEAERDALDRWWQTHFPFASWGRIQWSAVQYHVCQEWTERWKDLPDRFHALCEAEHLQDPEVTIIWSNALRPVLHCTLRAARDHAVTIFEADFDIWIVCPSQQWCIEVYHEGEICFGKANTPLA